MVKVLLEYKNKAVIADYIDIVARAFAKNGEELIYAKGTKEVSKNDVAIVPVFTDAIRLYLKGCRKIVLWQQGLNAEESFMRNGSNFRKFLIERLEKFILKRAKLVFFVSEEMKRYYEKKYRLKFKNYYVMPCFNEEFNAEVYNKKDYSKKVFTYAGSMTVWQCFDKTAKIYKYIEENVPNTHFTVLTFDTKKATEIINLTGIKNYTVQCVPKQEVNSKLADATYGFVIRDDDPVNRVSTPTKFSSYLAAGVIPIFSDVIADFTMQTKALKYVHSVPQKINYEDIVDFVNRPINKNELFEEYQSFFERYYCKEKYINEISEKVKELK